MSDNPCYEFSFLEDAVINPLRTQAGLDPKAFRTLAWDDTTPETNWLRVQYTYELMRDNLHGASIFPGAVAALLRSRAWEGYEFRGKLIQKTSFREFVESNPPQGLGVSVEELIRLCQKHPAVVEGIDQVLKGESTHGGARRGAGFKLDNIQLENGNRKKSPTGTSLQRSLRRLRSMAETDGHAAKLREKVLRGEMSANRALLELRTRKKYYTVEATPEALAVFARKYLMPDQIKRLIRDLS